MSDWEIANEVAQWVVIWGIAISVKWANDRLDRTQRRVNGDHDSLVSLNKVIVSHQNVLEIHSKQLKEDE